jgi:hypothetical protein
VVAFIRWEEWKWDDGRAICICMIKSKKCIGHRCLCHRASIRILGFLVIDSTFLFCLLPFSNRIQSSHAIQSSHSRVSDPCQVVAQPHRVYSLSLTWFRTEGAMKQECSSSSFKEESTSSFAYFKFLRISLPLTNNITFRIDITLPTAPRHLIINRCYLLYCVNLPDCQLI